MTPFLLQTGHNGPKVSTMDADGPTYQHQSISSHNTDPMCSQPTMQHFMVQAGQYGHKVNTMGADGLVSQHQSISSNSTGLMYSQLTIKP